MRTRLCCEVFLVLVSCYWGTFAIEQIAEDSDVTLEISRDPQKNIKEVKWSYGETDQDITQVIVSYIRDISLDPAFNTPFCSHGDASCTSNQGSLDTNTGALTLYRLKLDGAGHYKCEYKYSEPNALFINEKFTVRVYVQPQEEDVVVTGLRDPFPANQSVELTCRVDRIQPQLPPGKFYWMLDGKKLVGAIITIPNSDNTHQQTISLTYPFQIEDDMKELKCVLDPEVGERVVITNIVSLLYGPRGKPTISPSALGWHTTEDVVLACNLAPHDEGKPVPYTYLWHKRDDTSGQFPLKKTATNELKFVMEESTAGNYSCSISNKHGATLHSDFREVLLLQGPAPSPSSKSDYMTGVIAGVIAAVVIVVVLVVIFFVLHRRRNRSKASAEPNYAEMQIVTPQSTENGDHSVTNGGEDAGLTSTGRKRQLRPQRGLESEAQQTNGQTSPPPEHIYAPPEHIYANSPVKTPPVNNNYDVPQTQKKKVPEPEGIVYSDLELLREKKDASGRKPTPSARNIAKIKPTIHKADEDTEYAVIDHTMKSKPPEKQDS